MTRVSVREALLGIDVGTTNVKAAVYDLEGRLVAISSHRLPSIRSKPGWEEYDAEELFLCTARTVQETVSQLGKTKVLGVSVASMAETAFPVNGKGEVLHNAVAWHDERSLPQATWWRRVVGEERIYSITGLSPVHIFGANKLMWFKENEPEAFARTACWLNVADYVAYRLCGVQATDFSLASRLMLLELKTGRWSPDLIAASEIPETLFADLVPSGQHLGVIHAEAQAVTGLSRGTPVVAGGHDHPCGALALGITQAGDVLDSIGTSESIFSVIDTPQLRPELSKTGYQQGFHVVPDTFYCNGGLYTAGRCIEWLKDFILPDADDPYEELAVLASSTAKGSDGVYFLPHLRMANTPIDDAHSRGAFVGLSVSSSRGSAARAVIEGLAYEAHYALDGLGKNFGIVINKVRAIGGGTRTTLLMEVKAALLDIPLEVVSTKEASTLGAAMLAGVGAGVYQDTEEATRAVKPSSVQILANPELQSFYQHSFETVYKKLYPNLSPISHAIHEASRQT